MSRVLARRRNLRKQLTKLDRERRALPWWAFSRRHNLKLALDLAAWELKRIDGELG